MANKSRGSVTDFLSLNPYEKDGIERVEWEDILDTDFVLLDFETEMQYSADGQEMRYVCLNIEITGKNKTTLIWSAPLHSQCLRLDKAALPLDAKIGRKRSANKREYVTFV